MTWEFDVCLYRLVKKYFLDASFCYSRCKWRFKHATLFSKKESRVCVDITGSHRPLSMSWATQIMAPTIHLQGTEENVLWGWWNLILVTSWTAGRNLDYINQLGGTQKSRSFRWGKPRLNSPRYHLVHRGSWESLLHPSVCKIKVWVSTFRVVLGT